MSNKKIGLMPILPAHKQAALSLYPEDWKVVCTEGLKVDQNANVRAVAENVFEHVFKVLQSEKVAHGVAEAFLRRFKHYGDDPNFNTANMAVALLFLQCELEADG